MLSSDPNSLIQWFPRLVRDPYWHPDQIKSKPAPEGLKHELWWPLLKCLRVPLRRDLPLTDSLGRTFGVSVLDGMQPVLHQFDRNSSALVDGLTRGDKSTQWTEVKHAFKVSSQMDEAIASVQLSGETVNHAAMRELLRSGRHASQQAEQKVISLFRVLKKVSDLSSLPITEESLAGLNRQILEHTATATTPGHLRTADSADDLMPAETLSGRLKALCAFAEGAGVGAGTSPFLHPMLRAVVSCFWLLHDRPFENGNRRTARALLSWSMLRAGYPMFESMSVSATMLKTGVDLQELIRRVMSDDCDLTYFVLPVMDGISAAYADALERLHHHEEELHSGRQAWNLAGFLNPRQEDIVLRAMKQPGTIFTIEAHRASQDLAYATARADLLRLEQVGLMVKRQRGKGFVFETAPNWLEKLKLMSSSI